MKYVLPLPLGLYKNIPQPLDLAYKGEATFNTVLFHLIKSSWLEKINATILSDMNPVYEGMIEDIPELVKLDFSTLL